MPTCFPQSNYHFSSLLHAIAQDKLSFAEGREIFSKLKKEHISKINEDWHKKLENIITKSGNQERAELFFELFSMEELELFV